MLLALTQAASSGVAGLRQPMLKVWGVWGVKCELGHAQDVYREHAWHELCVDCPSRPGLSSPSPPAPYFSPTAVPLPLQGTIIGLFRDLRGIATATNSRRTYSIMFDWLYPQHFPVILKCLEVWGGGGARRGERGATGGM